MGARRRRFGSIAESLAIETFSVVLAIVLALGANALHDRRVQAARAREALMAIRAELVANRETLSAKVLYHRAMHDSIDALITRTRTRVVPGGLRAIANWNGLGPSQLLDDAWQTARATQSLEHLAYSMVLNLSGTYALQQRIGDVNRAFFATVYTPAFATGGVAAFGSMSNYLEDVSSTEGHLLDRYEAEISALTHVLDGR